MNKKIATVLTLSPSGSLARIARTVAWLEALGYQVFEEDLSTPVGERRVRVLVGKALMFLGAILRIPSSISMGARLRFTGADVVTPKIIRSDLVVVEEIDLLPLMSTGRSKMRSAVILELRDYGRLLPGRNRTEAKARSHLRGALYRFFIPLADRIITVSHGLAKLILEEQGRESCVIKSYPNPVNLAVQPVSSGRIRLVYHGRSGAHRSVDSLIEIAALLDSRFSLDLYLVAPENEYSRIQELATHSSCVRVLRPVPQNELIRHMNTYDIGLLFHPPRTRNSGILLEQNTRVLPNKVFEYVQSRIAVASGPSVDVVEELTPFGCIFASSSFDVQDFATQLNSLTTDQVYEAKLNAAAAASQLTATSQEANFRKLVLGLERGGSGTKA